MIIANEKHYNNEKKALSLLKNVTILYTEEQNFAFSLDFDHPDLLIMDVFTGQMTFWIRESLNKNHILLKKFQLV